MECNYDRVQSEGYNMGGIDVPSPVRAPTAKPPIATPDVGPEAGDIAKRRRPRGRDETFLTGALIPSDGRSNRTVLR